MKKQIFLYILLSIICIACYNTNIPNVVRRLTQEEIAILPYYQGQQFYMVGPQHDTTLWTVQLDTIIQENRLRYYADGYSRYVEIYDMNNNNIFIEIYPEKQMEIRYNDAPFGLNFNYGTPRTLILDNDTFNRVYVTASYNNQSLYYSIEEGIIRIQNDTTYWQLVR